MSAHASLIPELERMVERGSPQRRAATLKRITALFLAGVSEFSDDHIELFDLVFSRLIAASEAKARTDLSHRLAPLGKAPIETVRRLAQDDDAAVSAPVLKQSWRLTEADLVDIARSKSQAHLLALAGRARIAEPVTDALLQRGGRDVVHRVAENRGARLSDDSFFTLVSRAERDDELAEKVGLRPDIPPRLLRDLLLKVTPQVQRRLLASATPQALSEMRRVLVTVSNGMGAAAPPPREDADAARTVDALRAQGLLNEAALADFARSGQYGETIAALASLCSVPIEVMDRLMAAEQPDPLLILCKSAGWSWPTAKGIIAMRRGGEGRSSPGLDAAHADFERLSPATARRVLRFWQARPDGL